MASVEIEYCVPCGYQERAQSLQGTLLTTFGEQLDRVSLVTGNSGVFTVTMDGDLVFDKSEDQYDPDEIVRAVRQRV